MSRRHDLAFLELALTSGVDVIAAMPVLAAPLKRLFPAFSLSLIRVDASSAPMHHYSEHFDETSHRIFAEAGHVYATAPEDPAAFANLMKQARPWGNLVRPDVPFRDGGIYQNLFARNGIFHVLDAAVRDAEGPLGIVGIFREQKARRFDVDDVELLGELYPWFVHAFAAHRALAREGPFALPKELLAYDELDAAMLVADPHGVIRWASPGARTWLESASAAPELPALFAAPPRLPEACRHVCAMFRKARSARARGQAAEVPTITLAVPGGRLRLRAYALDPCLDGDEGAIGVQLTLESPRALRVLGALEKSSLSPQQRRIAFGMWRGRSLAELREALDLGAGTLKSYVKDLYLRLDVRSAAELVARLDDQARSVTFDLGRHLPTERALAAAPPHGG